MLIACDDQQAIAGLLAAALAVTACGGGDGGATATSSTTSMSPAAAWCDELAAMSYEARKLAVDDLGSGGLHPTRADAETLCGGLVGATEDAAALEEGAAAITADTIGFDVACDTGAVRATITNQTDVPVAFVGASLHYRDSDRDNEDVRLSTLWTIAPGESVEEERPVTGSGGGDHCTVLGHAFHADASRIDAALPGTSASGPATADDAATWLPAIVERHTEWFADQDPDEVASFLDVRNPDYREYLDEPHPAAARPVEVRWCETFDGPNDRTVVVEFRSRSDAFSYTDEDGEPAELDAWDRTQIAVARRGKDGAWRLLSPLLHFGERMCVGVDEVVDELRAGGLLPDGADVDGLRTLDAIRALPGLSGEAGAIVAEHAGGT